jgi:pyridoxine 4-dehydrogenase
MSNQVNAATAGTVTLGGDLTVNRLGLGTNRVRVHEPSATLLRAAVELGINFIDTADRYTGGESEQQIHDALAPYPQGLVIATKGGAGGREDGSPLGTPEYIQSVVEGSLQRLGVEQIQLYYLHRVDPQTPLEVTMGKLAELQAAGTLRHIALSAVTVEQIEAAQKIVPIAAVQNRYNLTDRSSEAVLAYCEANDIVFVPYAPLKLGENAKADALLADLATRYHATSQQIALAWLLKRSPWMAPIPGTTSVEHLKENLAAADIDLSDADYAALTAL